MPIYEYLCSECGFKFELLRSFSQVGEKASCPRCDNPAERKLSTFASFSKNEAGVSVPVAGTGSSCGSCSSTGCSTCGP